MLYTSTYAQIQFDNNNKKTFLHFSNEIICLIMVLELVKKVKKLLCVKVFVSFTRFTRTFYFLNKNMLLFVC